MIILTAEGESPLLFVALKQPVSVTSLRHDNNKSGTMGEGGGGHSSAEGMAIARQGGRSPRVNQCHYNKRLGEAVLCGNLLQMCHEQ